MEQPNTASANPWIFAHWDEQQLAYVAGALQTISPLGFADAEARASYIRDLAERELNNRISAGEKQPFDISTGGFTVCFVIWSDGRWHAIATISAYACAKFIASLGVPGQECYWHKAPNGTGGTYDSVRVRSMGGAWYG